MRRRLSNFYLATIYTQMFPPYYSWCPDFISFISRHHFAFVALRCHFAFVALRCRRFTRGDIILITLTKLSQECAKFWQVVVVIVVENGCI